MSYTNATVIIAAVDQAAAQADFPGSFTSGFTDPGGAVFYVCSGLWANEDLARITDGSVAWPSRVYYDDVGAVLERLGLTPIVQEPKQPDPQPQQAQ